ncbi:alpha/beta fold hydrolase [Geoalkalibacter subterraneus]|uniref:alpha/beta fold hydrolase n=1 Tax=Geoalkalibacter subterraneus TaxID=483547 RepID=UPI000694D177|nr:alpha/beta fold hydrolase [Geoalkalibacter subterraneus]
MKTLMLSDGRTMAYREAGQGLPVVLLHGWSLSSAVFDELAAGLARDFRVLAFDLRGHGCSSPGEGYELADFSADIREALDLLSIKSAALLGWSLGGQVALRLAHEIPSFWTRLVLISTTPRFISGSDWEGGLSEIQVRGMARKLSRQYEQTLQTFFEEQFIAGELDSGCLEEIAAFAQPQECTPHPEAALEALETLKTEDLRLLVRNIDLPTLVIHGSEDLVTPLAAGRYLAEHLPHGRLWEVESVGHAPFLSRPHTVLAVLREFLQ